ncbi:unnamed protein product [Strongylus vulgaris]|uniref:Uncharacterized protein n=1 Tax=Strongylus vulgaris TaxID=40348 RepID=A0A3P7JZ31_STRVU|nr:unnamed protein product [Strongylus vulgaris]
MLLLFCLDNIFSRGDLDYRNLLLDANSASLFVGARGRIFRLWAYNINDTSENLLVRINILEYVDEFLPFLEWGNPSELPSVYSGIRTGMAGENHLIYRPALMDKGKEVHSSMRTVYTDNRWLYGRCSCSNFYTGVR